MVDKEILLKRINILEPIYKRLNSLQDGYRQNIALIGPAGVGKTTILKYLTSTFKRPQLTFAYVNLQGVDFNYLIYKLLGSLLYDYLAEKGLIIKDDFTYLVKAAENFLPRTCSAIKLVQELIEKRKINEAYQKALDSTDTFTQESGKKLVLIIDEFHILDEMNIKNPFAILGKKIMLQKSVAFIVASSQQLKANKILSEKLSLLFGNFEIINLTALEQKTGKEFISNILSPYSMPDSQIDFLINLTGGYPLYIKVIGRELVRLIEKYSINEIDNNIIITVLYNLLSKETGLLNEKFSNIMEHISPAGSEYAKNALNLMTQSMLLIASGNYKISDLAKKAGTTKAKIQARLNKLNDQEIISKNASFYKITDPVFELWLRIVYSRRLNRFTDDETGFKNQFDNEIENMIENFNFESKRKLLDRIEEVFRKFQDESVIFERRKFKLSRFDDVSLVSFASENVKEGIIGRSALNVWVAGLKTGNISEPDVSDFANECRKYKDKHLKKLLISFGDVDLNASLLAKEEKIQTWGLQHLNVLLSLFGKPKIVSY